MSEALWFLAGCVVAAIVFGFARAAARDWRNRRRRTFTIEAIDVRDLAKQPHYEWPKLRAEPQDEGFA